MRTDTRAPSLLFLLQLQTNSWRKRIKSQASCVVGQGFASLRCFFYTVSFEGAVKLCSVQALLCIPVLRLTSRASFLCREYPRTIARYSVTEHPADCCSIGFAPAMSPLPRAT